MSSQQCTSCKGPKALSSTATHDNCPLRMSDGRSLGDYVYGPRCQHQYKMQFDNSIASSFDYKHYLIQNAENIMRANAQKAFKSTQS